MLSPGLPSEQVPQPVPGQQRRNSWAEPRVVALCVGAIVVALIAVLATRETAGKSQQSPILGQVAPAISGIDVLSKRPIKLSDAEGRWTVVNFFATWCTPCVAEHDDLVRFHESNVINGEDALLAVVFDDAESDVKKFFEERGGGWPIVDEPKVAVDYGVTGVPETYIIAPNGKVVASVRGGVNDEALVAKLDDLKAQFAAVNSTVAGSTTP